MKKLSVIPKRYLFFAVSAFCIVASFFTLIFGNLNLGIDMTGGTRALFEYSEYNFNEATLRSEANVLAEHRNIQGNIVNNVSVYKISGEDAFIVEAGFIRDLPEKEIDHHKIQFRDELQDRLTELGNIELVQYTNIGASFGDYIKNTAKITLLIAILAIALYIAYAFSGAIGGIPSLSFAAITLVTLFHDVIISTGLYIMASTVFSQFQIDTFFITALLTILGYSINDTIVVFDRIRSNLKEFGGKTKNLEDIVELSVRESFTRSMYTSFTLAFVLLCILVFGPESISGFTLAMLFGTIVGTYSSLFIASPLLYELHKNTELSEYIKNEDKSFEDTIVV